MSIDDLRSNNNLSAKIMGDAENLLLKNQIVDCVLMLHVAEHIKNPSKCFYEINRCLKPGGKVIIFTPNLYNISGIFIFGKFAPFWLRKIILRIIGRSLSSSPYHLYYRMNSIKGIKKIAKITDELKIEQTFYIPSIPDWFYKLKCISFAYYIVMRLICLFKLNFFITQFCFILSKECKKRVFEK